MKLCLGILALVVSFLVAYFSKSFWLKQQWQQAFPSIHFTSQFIFILDILKNDLPTEIFYSTVPEYRQDRYSVLRSPVIRTVEHDLTRKGRYDSLMFSASVPLLENEKVIRVRLAAEFDYELTETVRLRMKSLGLLDYTMVYSSASVTSVGDLSLIQTRPFSLKTQWMDETLFNTTKPFSWSQLLSNYHQRDYRTDYQQHPSWTLGRALNSDFTLNVTFNYPYPQWIIYQPDAWEVLKFSWIQFLSIFVVVGGLLAGLYQFSVQQHIFPTVLSYQQVRNKQ